MSLCSSYLYTCEGTRALDKTAIEGFNIPGFTLMTRAGQAVVEKLRQHFPRAKKILVLAGPGNNGGDAYVVAALLKKLALDVELVYLLEPGTEDAKRARQQCQQQKVPIRPWQANIAIEAYDVVVDGLLGTGLKPLTGDFLEVVQSINRACVPVVAIDVPTGLDADRGQALGDVVKAQLTVTFIGQKQGLFTGQAKSVCGKLYFDDLQVPKDVYQQVPYSAKSTSYLDCRAQIPKRASDSHKGNYGHVLIIGGDHGMMGAPLMSGQAALRVGAGLVSVATRQSHAPMLSIARPELMVHGVEDSSALTALLEKASVIAIGPGLGQSEWSHAMFKAVLQTPVPKVLDADALNLLSVSPEQHQSWVLTPHPGEAARLLQSSTKAVQNDRFAALQQLQATFGGQIVLKGAGSLISTAAHIPWVCLDGNPGMASAGMGDVLTGVIVGLLAQGLSLEQAALVGVCLHAYAGDKAAMAGERGLIATDLLPELRYALNEYHNTMP